MMPKQRWIVTALLSLGLLAGLGIPQGFCQTPKHVLVLPPTVHAQQKLVYLQKGVVDMLTTRLTAEGQVVASRQRSSASADPIMEKSQALSLARKEGADFVVFGSLTVFGNSVSTDLKMVKVASGQAEVAFNQTGKSHDDIIAHVSLFATQVNETVFGRKASPAFVSSAQSAPSREDYRRHPESLIKELRRETDQTMLISGGTATPTQSIWRSRRYPFELQGIAIGDVDGDGNVETVVISSNTVYVYRWQAGQLVKMLEKKGGGGKHVGVDVADLNGDGRAEIFVSSYYHPQDRFLSFVLAYNGQDFAVAEKNIGWMFRTLSLDSKKVVLVAQRTVSEEKLFQPGIFEVAYEAGEYVEGERLPVPRYRDVDGLAHGDILNNGQPHYASYVTGGYLAVLTPKGDEEWTSPEKYGGGGVYVEYGPETDMESAKMKYLEPRVLIADVDKDQKSEVLVLKNTDLLGRLLAQTRMFKSGRIECLAWDRMGLFTKWRTRDLSAYISDFYVGDMDNDGNLELVFCLVKKASGPTQSGISQIVLQNLSD